MRLPALLLRQKNNVHKNDFGHVLILAGSKHMLGAACLSALAAMRSGAGLVSVGIPQSLNAVLQKKISSVVMTLSLPETSEQSLSVSAFKTIQKNYHKYNAIAIGPGLSTHKSTKQLILKIIATSPLPLVIDADALTAIASNINILQKTKTIKILTPHPGEMARLAQLSKAKIEKNRRSITKNFAQKHNCIVLLKGHQTVVANPQGKLYINKTGNAGMATAGSGDVLTGMIAAFLAQGIEEFEAAKLASYIHGKAGDVAARKKTKLSMIATDIIEAIPVALLPFSFPIEGKAIYGLPSL